ncbi:WD40-repeat-containing domain protein [Melanogaster broomeanus]|nr:WD40-repeat-containing domain protein [Melanogaster broomeanus]
MSRKRESRPIHVFEGCESEVQCVAFFPDEEQLVSGSRDGTLRKCDLKTGKEIGEGWKGHTDAVCTVDVSHDGNWVVSGSGDHTIILWDAESGAMVRVLKGHLGTVQSVHFSSDSKRIASGSTDNTVRVWLVNTGKWAFAPIECHAEVRCVRYAPNRAWVASAAENVEIWDANTGSKIRSIRDSTVHSLAWTSNSDQIIGGARWDKLTTEWNCHTGNKSGPYSQDISSPESLLPPIAF